MTVARVRTPLREQPAKKLKTAPSDDDSERLDNSFAPGIFHPSNVERLSAEYKPSAPFKHCVVDKLFNDDLLVKVKEEILQNIHFTEKETDIYKVHQTGDLASLSYLDNSQLALFPSLLTLRNQLYGNTFRQFVRTVTGCGHLSGTKQDMSVNTYTKGCHLLNHDDVIGSRRVSYILYLPLPHDEEWKPEYGGALELYPVVENPASGMLEPLPVPSKVIPPSWNQFVFFEVQPGRSFHSVEEVVIESQGSGKQRLSISGWFHKPVEGEEAFGLDDPSHEKSSLEQLYSASAPLTTYPSTPSDSVGPLPTQLTPTELSFLSKYLNPVYLSTETLAAISGRFADESSLELHSFLRESLASELEAALQEQDMLDEFSGEKRGDIVPKHESGTTLYGPWRVTGPPHKHRYCVIQDGSEDQTKSDKLVSNLRELQDNLFPSPAFRSWLSIVSSLLPLAYTAEARRFRPGLDYTLARSEEKDARLDVSLCLTPQTPQEDQGWKSGRWGGWECYMAPHEGEDDPAVYRAGKQGKKLDGDEEEDGTLLVSQPGFNRLLLVLRDQGVLRFVKYVSAEARGSRWDISGEWEVGGVEEEEDVDTEED